MNNLTLNIANLFAEVFGVSSPVFIPWGRELKTRIPDNYKDVSLSAKEEAQRMSWMGTPVLDSFTIDGGSYNTYDEEGKLTRMTLDDFVFPYATIVEFERNMNVTKTKVLGNAGTVKEMYGLDDWNINIRGFCLDDKSRQAQKTAYEQLNELVRWRNVVDSVNVTGYLFKDKDIYSMVIENMTLAPVQGKENVYSFSIRAVSDKPIELRL